MSSDVNPVLVEVTRGALVESRHRGAAVVSDARGGVVAAWGDIDRPVYARSAIKPLQALALVETGALDAFGLGEPELALACASHSAEAIHQQVAQRWLDRLGLDVEALECGAHAPTSRSAARALIEAGESPTALHNNCSGKHLGFLTAALHLGEPTRGYIGPDHPSQQRWRWILEALSGEPLAAAPVGTDGCGIPVIALSLAGIARAMARLADPDGLPPARAEAVRRVIRAMTAEPVLVAGSDRFDTRVMQAVAGRAVLKTGAEGVYTAVLPQAGWGVALKIDDGAARAAQVAVGRVLDHLGVFTEAEREALAGVLRPTVHNRAGRAVGAIHPAWP